MWAQASEFLLINSLILSNDTDIPFLYNDITRCYYYIDGVDIITYIKENTDRNSEACDMEHRGLQLLPRKKFDLSTYNQTNFFSIGSKPV